MFQEKVKTDSDNNPDPATFWRKRREVEQVEKTTSDLKEEVSYDNMGGSSTVAVEDSLLNEENENIVKDDVVKAREEKEEDEWSDVVHRNIVEDVPYEFSQEVPPDVPRLEARETKQSEAPDDPHQLERVSEIKPVFIEKRVNWQDLQHNEDESTSCSLHDDIQKRYESMNINDEPTRSNEQTTTPVHMNNRQPLKETVIEIEDEESILEERRYNSVNQVHFDTQGNYEILRNPARQEVRVEQPLTTSSSPLSRESIYSCL